MQAALPTPSLKDAIAAAFRSRPRGRNWLRSLKLNGSLPAPAARAVCHELGATTVRAQARTCRVGRPDESAVGVARAPAADRSICDGAGPRPGIGPTHYALDEPCVHDLVVDCAAARIEFFGAQRFRCAQPDRADSRGVPGAARSPGGGDLDAHRRVHRAHERRRAGRGGLGSVAVHRGLADAEDRGIVQPHLARPRAARHGGTLQPLLERPAGRSHSAVRGHGHHRRRSRCGTRQERDYG